MRFIKEANQASKISLVFIVITSLFTLLGKLGTIVPFGENNVNIKFRIESFLHVNLAWLITSTLIILILCIYIKKVERKFSFMFLQNPMIRLTSGLLIIFEGMINLTNKMTILFINIQTFRQSASLLGDKIDELMSGALTSSIIPILVYLFQNITRFIFYTKK